MAQHILREFEVAAIAGERPDQCRIRRFTRRSSDGEIGVMVDLGIDFGPMLRRGFDPPIFLEYGEGFGR